MREHALVSLSAASLQPETTFHSFAPVFLPHLLVPFSDRNSLSDGAALVVLGNSVLNLGRLQLKPFFDRDHEMVSVQEEVSRAVSFSVFDEAPRGISSA